MLVIAIYSLVQTKVLHKDYVDIFGYTAFEVSTGSMSPNIKIGDIIIDKIGSDGISIGDIVTYKKEAVITHRIAAIDGDSVITKGDANNAEDSPITKQDIIGKVIQTIPNVGIWKKVFLTPLVYTPLITAIILIGLALSYSKRTKDEKND